MTAPLPPPPDERTAITLLPTFEAELAHVWAQLEQVPREVLDSYRLKLSAANAGRKVALTAEEAELQGVPLVLIEAQRQRKWIKEGMPGLDPNRLTVTASHTVWRDKSPSGKHEVVRRSVSLSVVSAAIAGSGIGVVVWRLVELWMRAHGGGWS